MNAPHGLNGLGPLAEATKLALANARRDWRTERAELKAELAEGLLALERVRALALERIAQVKDGLPGRDGVDGAPGKDGAPGRDGVDGIRGLDGKDGAPGRDGADADQALIEKLIRELIDGAVAQIRQPKDGAPGRDGTDGKDGAAGHDGAPGKDGRDGIDGKDGAAGVFAAPKPFKAGAITYRGELVYHEGSTFCALADTAAAPPHADFQPVAFKGRDGKDAYGGRARGLYDARCSDYRAMDVVALNGSEWRAMKDNPGPCPGDGWALGAKGGTKGRTGDKGERGEAGVGVEGFAREGFALLIVLTDGSTVRFDMRPMFEAFAQEFAGA